MADRKASIALEGPEVSPDEKFFWTATSGPQNSKNQLVPRNLISSSASPLLKIRLANVDLRMQELHLEEELYILFFLNSKQSLMHLLQRTIYI